MYDRDALLATVDLRVLAEEFLGPHSGPESSPTWRCPNPHHAQTGRTPPVTVFTSRRGEQRWRCHGCGTGGTAIDLVLACRRTDFRGALDYLAERAARQSDPAGPRRPPTVRPRPEAHPNRQGLDDYVHECAEALWTPAGRAVRRWLTEHRGLQADVLRANLIGADLGPRRQPRPDGMPRATGAVLPVIVKDQAVYAQIRVVNPALGRPRYLNPSADLVSNPRIARFRPAMCEHDEVIVTEGAIDGLSAAAAGYRAVAVFGAGYPNPSVAHELSRLPYPLVIAFDSDEAGDAGARRLRSYLEAADRPSVRVRLRHGDLNDALVRANDWPAVLASDIRASTRPSDPIETALDL